MEQISIENLVPVIEEVIEKNSSFRLYPRGTSMLPSIVEDEDSVLLSKPENLEIYDAVLYKRDNGQFVLHRIVSEHDEYFDMCGDNQLFFEKNVSKSSVIAKVTGIYKKDTFVDVFSKQYKNEIKNLYRKKIILRTLSYIKKLIYPIYKIIFK